MGRRSIPMSGNQRRAIFRLVFVERQKLTMRMHMRHFIRPIRRIDSHGHAVALHYMYYNFCRMHQTLRVTPAMEAGIR